MNTVLTSAIDSTSSEDTEQLGQRLGQRLSGGEVIELISDLGGGKTTFVRGLARGLGSHDHVSSPTFTINKVYKSGKLRLYHYDLYRLFDADLVPYELSEVIGDRNAVVVLEWGGVVNHILPAERLSVHIKRKGDTKRQFVFHYPSSLKHLVEKL